MMKKIRGNGECMMATIQEQFTALSDIQLARFCELLDIIELKRRTGTSYSSEIYSLSDEFQFSEANLLDTDNLALLADREARNRWQKTQK